MTRKEEPYFNLLFSSLKNLKPKRVLEVGYGLGISARLIQKYLKPSFHLITEIEKNIGKEASKFSQSYNNIEIVICDWANYNTESKFDFIFFDPFDYSEINNVSRSDAARKLKNLLETNGVLSHPHFGDGDVSCFPGFNHIVLKRYKVPKFITGDGILCEDVATVIRCREEDDIEKIALQINKNSF